MGSIAIKLIKENPAEIPRLLIKCILFFLPPFRQGEVYYRRRAAFLHFLANKGLYERKYLNMLPFLVEKGSIVADVGANFGVYTKRLAELCGPSGKVFAFEPLDAAFKILPEYSGSPANTTFLQIGLSNKEDDNSEFHIPLIFSVIPEPALSSLSDMEVPCQIQKVNLRKLDSFANELKGVSFIKVDVEGFEKEFFEGAQEVIKTNRPVIQFEADKIPPTEIFLKNYCETHSYDIYLVDGKGQLVKATSFSPKEQNLYLIPKEKFKLIHQKFPLRD